MRRRAQEELDPVTTRAPWDVVFFSGVDFHSHAQRAQAVAQGLAARGARVLYVDNLGLRLPRLSDRRRLVRRLRSAMTPARAQPQERTWVVSPLVPPLQQWRPVRSLTRRWLARRVGQFRRAAGDDRPLVVWTYLPNPVIGDVAAAAGARALAYEYADLASIRLDTHSRRHRARVIRWEDEMLSRADVVFVASEHLREARGIAGPTTVVIPHGVRAGHDRPPGVPPEVERLPRPRVGFVGSIGPTIDVELLEGLARARPDWSLVLVGPQRVSVRGLAGLPNVLLAGERPQEEVPGFLAGCDVALIPYRSTVPGIETATPLKLREYLSHGLPVVSVDIPAARGFGPDVETAEGAEGFAAAVERALGRQRRPGRPGRTWEEAVEEMVRHVGEALGAPAAGGRRRAG